MKYKQQIVSEVTKKFIYIDNIFKIEVSHKNNNGTFDYWTPKFEEIDPVIEKLIRHQLSEIRIDLRNEDYGCTNKTSFMFNECIYTIWFTRVEKEYTMNKIIDGE